MILRELVFPKELTSDEVCEIKRVYNSTIIQGQWIQSGER